MALAVLLRPALAISTKLEMAVITPEAAPGVLNQPVLLAGLRITLSVSDHGDCMVDISLIRIAAVAVFIVHNTLRVSRQAAEVGVNRDTYGVLSNQLAHPAIADHVLLVALTVEEAFACGFLAWIRTLVLPSLVTSRIGIPVDDALFLGEIVGVGHPAAVATPVDLITVE